MAPENLKLRRHPFEILLVCLFFGGFLSLYAGIQWSVYWFLIPLFLLLRFSHTWKGKILGVGVVLCGMINFYYFYPYGFSFMAYVGLAHLLFYVPIFLGSWHLLRRPFSTLSIPSLFLVQFYLFQFLPFNNFGMNLIAFLPHFPLTITYIGSYGMFFLLVLLQVLAAELIWHHLIWKSRSPIPGKYAILLLVLFTFLLPYQSYDSSGSISMLGIQGNLQQDWFSRMEKEEGNINKYLRMTEDGLEQYGADVVIWPEYTMTTALEFKPAYQHRFTQVAEQYGTNLAVGSFKLVNPNSSHSKRYNTLFLFGEGFDERYYRAYEAVTLFDPQVALAETNPAYELGEQGNLGFLLCYEENFPAIAADHVQSLNATSLVSSGNQYYIGSEHGLWLSSLNARARAAESMRYLFRVMTSGYSVVYRPDGSVASDIEMNEEGILHYQVPQITENTVYSQHRKEIGASLFLLGMVLLLLAVSGREGSLVRNRY